MHELDLSCEAGNCSTVHYSTEAKLLISITDKPSQRPGNKSLTYICYSVVYKTIHFLSLT